MAPSLRKQEGHEVGAIQIFLEAVSVQQARCDIHADAIIDDDDAFTFHLAKHVAALHDKIGIRKKQRDLLAQLPLCMQVGCQFGRGGFEDGEPPYLNRRY